MRAIHVRTSLVQDEELDLFRSHCPIKHLLVAKGCAFSSLVISNNLSLSQIKQLLSCALSKSCILPSIIEASTEC